MKVARRSYTNSNKPPSASLPLHGDDNETNGTASSTIEDLQRACSGPNGRTGLIVLWNHSFGNNSSMSYLLDRQQQEAKPKPIKSVKGVVFHGCTFSETTTPRLLAEFFQQHGTRDLPYVEISRGVLFDSEKLIEQKTATRSILKALAGTESLSVRELRLSFVDLCDFVVGYELGRLFRSPTCKVRKLSLVCPTLDSETMRGFLNAFASHPTPGSNDSLEEITIELEHGQDILLDCLFPCLLRFSSCRKLNLIDTELTETALPHFTKLIQEHPTLESLDIIQSVDLFGADSLNNEGMDVVKSFATAVGESKTLKYLSLCRSGLTENGVSCLLKALKENTALETLDLRVNAFSFCDTWAKNIPNLKHLKRLELPYCNPSDYALLTRYLRQNTSLEEFHCGVANPNSEDIIAVLKRNKLLSVASRAKEDKDTIPTAAWPELLRQLSWDASPTYSFLVAAAPDIVTAFQTHD